MAAPPLKTSGPSTQELAELEGVCSILPELDYFQILKVGRDATGAEIKKAFYRESRAFHPDRYFQLRDPALKAKVNEIYKRITEAYYVLRDDGKRKRYAADVSGPQRHEKLRFNDTAEVETKIAAKREQDEQVGIHPKGRQFYQTGLQDAAAERWSAAERNFKMALTYEPSNARYKEKLGEVQQKLHDAFKKSGHAFKIR
ncbi:MAG TPA: DnaJ domain-containing protein [Myxococcaceae bacterium]|nr:DnaJ domain-containing protein [Myxococcaceae bacterium]